MENLKKREEKIKQIKDEEEQLEKKELIFRPEIINYPKINTYQGKIEDKLIAYGNKIKKDILNQQKSNNTQEKEHRPRLTKETEILGKKKRKNRENNLPNRTIFINPDYLVEPINKNKTIIQNKESNLIFSFDNINYLRNKDRSKSSDNIKTKYYKTYYNPLHPDTRKTTKILGRKIPLPQLTPDKNLYDYLYIEAKILKEKRDLDMLKDIEKRYPFKQNLYKTIDKYKIKKSAKKENNVFDRLYLDQNLRRKFNKTPDTKYYNSINYLKDSKTGQPLFKPIITRGPVNPYQREFSYDKDLNNKKKQHQHIENLKNIGKKRKKYIEKTNKIILEAKKLKYIELFHSLDSDNDGFISNKKIKISNLDNKKMVALISIFKELQYDGIQMDLNCFCEKVDKIEELKYIIESESYINV